MGPYPSPSRVQLSAQSLDLGHRLGLQPLQLAPLGQLAARLVQLRAQTRRLRLRRLRPLSRPLRLRLVKVRVRVRVRVRDRVRVRVRVRDRDMVRVRVSLLRAVDARRELDVEAEVVVRQQVEEGGRQLEGARPEHLGRVRDRDKVVRGVRGCVG